MGSRAHFMWLLVSGFISGIFVRSHVPLTESALVWIAMLSLAISSAALLARMPRERAIVPALIGLALTAGALRMEKAIGVPDPFLAATEGREIIYTGRVVAKPDVRERNVRVTLERAAADTRVRVVAILPAFSEVAYGDTLTIRGTLVAPERFETGTGRSFDYPGYLAVSGISHLVEHAAIIEREPAPRSPIGAIIGFTTRYEAGIAAALPEPHAGLGAGITAGDKRGLGPELADDFRSVSLTHIVVLSGYNIAIVLAALSYATAGRGAALRLGATAAVALFFVAVAGGAASAVRAALMACIAALAATSGRIYLAARALAVAAAGMAAWNPYVVAFDPGFQLSVLATAGLIAAAPLLAPLGAYMPERFGLREIAIGSASAQLAVLPLLIFQSGTFSLAAFPANLLALVAVPAAMLTTFVAGIAGMLMPALAPLAGFPAYILLSYIIGVANAGARLPFAEVSFPAFSWVVLLAAYAALGFTLALAHKKTANESGGGFRLPV